MFFLSQTFRSPRSTGAIFPSSEKLADLVIGQAKLGQAKFVVELGPGTGVFTKKIVAQVDPSSSYLAIEINDAFADHLALQFPGLKICQDSAENIKRCLSKNGMASCDRVISGLPWTAFEVNFQKKLLSKIWNVLEEGGIFITFSYYPFNYLPGGKSFRKIMEKYFDKVEESEIVRNIPPAFIYVCEK